MTLSKVFLILLFTTSLPSSAFWPFDKESSPSSLDLNPSSLDLTCTGILKQPPIGTTFISDKPVEFRVKVNTKSSATNNYNFELTEKGRSAPKQSLNSNFSNDANSWNVKVDELEIYLTNAVRDNGRIFKYQWLIDRNKGSFISNFGFSGELFGTATGKCIKTANVDKERKKLINNRKF